MSYASQFEWGGHSFYFDYNCLSGGILIDPATVNLDNPAWRDAYAHAANAYGHWSWLMDYVDEGHGYAINALKNAELQTFINRTSDFMAVYRGGFHSLCPVLAMINRYAERAQQIIDKRKQPIRVRRTNMMQKTAGYVYLVQSPTGAYKIGRTKNPDDRMRTFSVKLPFEVEYVALIPCDDMKWLEAELHNRYADKHVNGEWFNLDAADVETIRSLAVQS